MAIGARIHREAKELTLPGNWTDSAALVREDRSGEHNGAQAGVGASVAVKAFVPEAHAI